MMIEHPNYKFISQNDIPAVAKILLLVPEYARPLLLMNIKFKIIVTIKSIIKSFKILWLNRKPFYTPQ